MTLLGERQVIVDCDVLQADGGTRTASICGAYIALHDALTRVQQSGLITTHPLHSLCAAVSVGIHNGVPILDLPYVEDSSAEVDMNVVMLQAHDSNEPKFVEVQGTAEGAAFSQTQLTELLALATAGLREVFALQTQTLATPPKPKL
jgi:ribonuclease PH